MSTSSLHMKCVTKVISSLSNDDLRYVLNQISEDKYQILFDIILRKSGCIPEIIYDCHCPISVVSCDICDLNYMIEDYEDTYTETNDDVGTRCVDCKKDFCRSCADKNGMKETYDDNAIFKCSSCDYEHCFSNHGDDVYICTSCLKCTKCGSEFVEPEKNYTFEVQKRKYGG